MKDYQIRTGSSGVLPGAVYHQCLWIVKDMDRLQEVAGASFRGDMLAEDDFITAGAAALKRPPEAEEAAFKLDCIHRALLEVPPEYREGVLRSIRVRGAGYEDFAHENTWKRWKQRFIYSLAENLNLVRRNVY